MRLLLASLDHDPRAELRKDLLTRGYAVDTAEVPEDVLWHVESAGFDVVLLCAGEPQGALISRIREVESWPPVLAVLPAATADTHVVAELLDAGADDVLRAPYDGEELHARVRALARRPVHRRPTVLRVADLTLDPAQQTVRRGGHSIDLQPRKFAVLAELMRRPGEILTRSHLIDRVFSGGYDGTSNVIDAYVSHIRNKIDKPFGRQTIKTVRAVGYCLDPQG
jgi:two-component system OmpR family response regulator